MLSFIIMKTACTLKNDEKMSAIKTKGVTKRKGDKVEDRGDKNDEKMSAIKTKGVTKRKGDKVEDRGDKRRSKMSDASDDSNVKQSKSVAALKKEKVLKSLEKWLVPRKRLVVWQNRASLLSVAF